MGTWRRAHAQINKLRKQHRLVCALVALAVLASLVIAVHLWQTLSLAAGSLDAAASSTSGASSLTAKSMTPAVPATSHELLANEIQAQARIANILSKAQSQAQLEQNQLTQQQATAVKPNTASSLVLEPNQGSEPIPLLQQQQQQQPALDQPHALMADPLLFIVVSASRPNGTDYASPLLASILSGFRSAGGGKIRVLLYDADLPTKRRPPSFFAALPSEVEIHRAPAEALAELASVNDDPRLDKHHDPADRIRWRTKMSKVSAQRC
jgi:hypothetical protein